MPRAVFLEFMRIEKRGDGQMESKGTDRARRQPGELVFAIVLLLLGVGALGMSVALWLRMSPPRIASAAALPLLASGVWVLMALLNVLESVTRKALASGEGVRAKAAAALRFALPGGVALMLCLIAAYCALLALGVSFYVSTPLFLYGAMCALRRGGYIRNLLWTAAVMAVVVLVFHVLFGVAFP